ncbi:MAG: ribosomal-processing cysteine protease Prp [Clostridia bacterium]|nr:ribosomal-processing cysteine protease Prp [Clostridia bacterium]
MITVTFCGTKDRLTGFQIHGHSGFDEAGKDIVCAAVSSAAILTANTATEILHLHAQVTDADGEMQFQLEPADIDAAQPLLQGFLLHCRELSKTYPQNIRCQTKKYSIKIRRCNNNA